MEDKLHNFFNQNEFDIHEPHSGHLHRFQKRLQATQPKKRTSWKWMSIAASVVLLIGFGLGNMAANQPVDLGTISPKMAEVQNYFVNTIDREIKEIESSRNLQTEDIIERALDDLEELEDQYKTFVEELTKNGQQRKIINAMISNYQQRLEILQKTLEQIEIVKNPQNISDEIYI
jgi:septal ring factor EnvC (AmiA/AmiB activator)